jgi:DNA relaxase NicK
VSPYRIKQCLLAKDILASSPSKSEWEDQAVIAFPKFRTAVSRLPSVSLTTQLLVQQPSKMLTYLARPTFGKAIADTRERINPLIHAYSFSSFPAKSG